jgi:hypothetical protein
MNYTTYKEMISAIKDAKSNEERQNLVREISKYYISQSLQNGSSSIYLGTSSEDVKIIQIILAGLGFLTYDKMSTILDPDTMLALQKFGKKINVAIDTNQSISKNVIDLFTGYTISTNTTTVVKTPVQQPTTQQINQKLPKEAYDNKYNWPPPPQNIKRFREHATMLYGKIEYVSKGLNTDDIIITNNFVKENIIKITIPQLAKIQNPHGINLSCHRLAAPNILGLWQEWENLGLLSRIITFNGLFNARFVRGSRTTLSPHAYAAAFDINTRWNGLKKKPPGVGEKGSVRELVPSALRWGFNWGGFWKDRYDGMHFEVIEPKSQGTMYA